MNARLKQPPPTELMPATHSGAAPSIAARRMRWLVMALGFCCLMPYVAIPVGNRSAVQIGNILTLFLVLPVVALSWRKHPFWVYPLLIAPLCISTFKVSLAGDGDPALCFKVMIMW